MFPMCDEEVADFRDALESTLTGVHGSLEVGKTSYLNMAAANLNRNPLAERLKALNSTLSLEVTKFSSVSGKLEYALSALLEYNE